MAKNNNPRDVPGNSIASAAAFAKELQRKGETLLRFESVLDGLAEQDILVLSLSVKCKGGGRADYMVVVRATNGSSSWVCFSSGETLADALQGFVGRYLSGTLVWKDDQYAK